MIVFHQLFLFGFFIASMRSCENFKVSSDRRTLAARELSAEMLSKVQLDGKDALPRKGRWIQEKLRCLYALLSICSLSKDDSISSVVL
jgi:hypothetical protein